CSFDCCDRHLYLLSVPTRRSSDLLMVESEILLSDSIISFTCAIVLLSTLSAWDSTSSFCSVTFSESLRSIELSRSMGACFSDNRSEEHTSELQSRFDLVCRLLLEK